MDVNIFRKDKIKRQISKFKKISATGGCDVFSGKSR